MPKYDDEPEVAEAELSAASDALNKIQDDMVGASERLDVAEREVDDAEGADAEEAAMQRMQAIENELEGLRQDEASASKYPQDTAAYWGFD